MADIRLRVLGSVQLSGPASDRRYDSLQQRPKLAALLTFLAVARPRGEHQRDTLFGLFWPESTQEHARNSLNQAVFALRRLIGDEGILTHGGSAVGLDFDLVSCDVLEFEAARRAGELETAVKLYGGELLSGLYLSGCQAFERWLDGERERLGELAVDAATELSTRSDEEGNPAGSTRWLRKAAAIKPYDEPIQLRLLAAMARSGDRAGALQAYKVYEERLARDLDIAPSSDISVYVADLKNRESAAPPADESRPQTLAATPSTLEEQATPAGVSPAERRVVRGKRWRAGLTVGALVVAAITWGALWPRSDPEPADPDLDPNLILVLPFSNDTGDALQDGLGRQLADRTAEEIIRTGMLDVVPPAILAEAAASPGAAGTQPRMEALGGLLAVEAGAGLVLSGSYTYVQDRIVIEGRLTNPATRELVGTLPRVETPAETLSAAIDEFRRRAVGALAMLIDPRTSGWAASASQPSSFEVYRTFADGLDRFQEQRRASTPYFRRAYEMDSTFTAGALWAAWAYGSFWPDSGWAITRALEPKRGSLPPLDRALLDYQLAGLSSDQPAAVAALRRLVAIAPDPSWSRHLGRRLTWLNRPHEALEILASIDAPPEAVYDRGDTYQALAEVYHQLGRYEDVLAVVDRWRDELGEDGWQLNSELEALIALGRLEAFERRWSQIVATTGDSGTVFLRVLPIERLADHGHVELAGRLADEAIDSYRRLVAESLGRLPEDEYDPSIVRVLSAAGRVEEAFALQAKLMEWDFQPWHNRWFFVGWYGMLAARSGREDVARAAALELEQIGRRDPDRPVVHPSDLDGNVPSQTTLWRGIIATYLGNREEAVRLFGRALRLGVAVGQLERVANLPHMREYPPFQELIRPKG